MHLLVPDVLFKAHVQDGGSAEKGSWHRMHFKGASIVLRHAGFRLLGFGVSMFFGIVGLLFVDRFSGQS